MPAEPDHIAIPQSRERPAAQRLRRTVDCGGDFATRAGHPAIGYECHFEALILQHPKRRRQLVQFGHPIGARPLKADDDDHITVKFACLERRLHRILTVKHRARCLHCPALLIDRTRLESGATEIAGDQTHPPIELERCRGWA